MTSSGTEIFGLAAVTVMVASYGLESRGSVYVAIFAIACACAAVYAYLLGSYPFMIAESVWAVIAAFRWRALVRKPENTDSSEANLKQL